MMLKGRPAERYTRGGPARRQRWAGPPRAASGRIVPWRLSVVPAPPVRGMMHELVRRAYRKTGTGTSPGAALSPTKTERRFRGPPVGGSDARNRPWKVLMHVRLQRVSAPLAASTRPSGCESMDVLRGTSGDGRALRAPTIVGDRTGRASPSKRTGGGDDRLVRPAPGARRGSSESQFGRDFSVTRCGARPKRYL
jgi:hypothetical protein